MFRKMITIMIALSIFTCSAMASSQNGLKAAFNEFHYAVTVEWDQQDQSFLEARKAELAQALIDSGLTQAEILEFAKSQIKDEAVKRDLENTLQAVSANKLSPEEAEAIMIKSIEKSQMSGASWNGRVILMGVGIVLTSFVVIFIYTLSKIPEC